MFQQPDVQMLPALEPVLTPVFSLHMHIFPHCGHSFYDTVGIEGRRNDLCRRTHMPKRYWNRMTEMRDKV